MYFVQCHTPYVNVYGGNCFVIHICGDEIKGNAMKILKHPQFLFIACCPLRSLLNAMCMQPSWVFCQASLHVIHREILQKHDSTFVEILNKDEKVTDFGPCLRRLFQIPIDRVKSYAYLLGKLQGYFPEVRSMDREFSLQVLDKYDFKQNWVFICQWFQETFFPVVFYFKAASHELQQTLFKLWSKCVEDLKEKGVDKTWKLFKYRKNWVVMFDLHIRNNIWTSGQLVQTLQ